MAPGAAQWAGPTLPQEMAGPRLLSSDSRSNTSQEGPFCDPSHGPIIATSLSMAYLSSPAQPHPYLQLQPSDFTPAPQNRGKAHSGPTWPLIYPCCSPGLPPSRLPSYFPFSEDLACVLESWTAHVLSLNLFPHLW